MHLKSSDPKATSSWKLCGEGYVRGEKQPSITEDIGKVTCKQCLKLINRGICTAPFGPDFAPEGSIYEFVMSIQPQSVVDIKP